jgi:serine/threonine protein kinase
MIGKTIGPYQVVAKLGEGGMGEVYRARDTKTARNYDILPDGRFLGVVSAAQAQGGTTTERINVVLHWFEELKQRVPTK